VGIGALRAVPTIFPHRRHEWWVRFALSTYTLLNQSIAHFTQGGHRLSLVSQPL